MRYGLFDFGFDSDDDEAILAMLAQEAQLRLVGGSNMAVPQRIFVDVANHPNVGVAETTIVTVTIPALSLRVTGDFLEYVMEADLLNVGNSKTIRYKFDAQDINAAPWNNTLASTQLVQIGRIYRVTATTCRCYIANSLPFLGQANPFTQFGDITVANMNTNPIDFVVTLTGVVTSDITHRVSHLFLVA